MPVRVQLSRKKGWRMPPNTVSVARPGKFGNPFRVQPGLTPKESVSGFSAWVEGGALPFVLSALYLPELMERRVALLGRMPSLRGKNLACWCPLDQPCHADVLLELANADHLPSAA